MLKKFSMENSKSLTTPAITEEKRTGDNPLTDKHEYQSIVGSLIYLTTITRPDISYAVSKAGRAMLDPSQRDLLNVKHILRYLKATLMQDITYHQGEENRIEGYTDADFAGDLESR